MAREIAVFLNDDGAAASLYQPGKLVVYQRRQRAWEAAREMSFGLDQRQGLRTMRGQMARALDFLGECGVFVALAVSGMPYFEFEKAHVSVWEFEGKPMDFLDYILAEEERERLQAAAKPVFSLPVPVETAHGHYRISIKEIQENETGLTTKQVLLPFLRKGNFYELEILCNHLPPWLEGELAGGSLIGRTEKIGKRETRIIISKPCCNG